MSKKRVEIIGLAATLLKLGAAPDKLLNACHRAEIKHALRIQRSAQKKIPVDYGNLRASAFVASTKKTGLTSGGSFAGKDAGAVQASTDESMRRHEEEAKKLLAQFQQTVYVGFGAYYAFFVHESRQLWKGRKVRRGNNRWHIIWGTGEPKFLEKAVSENGGGEGLVVAIRDELKKEIAKMGD